MISIRSPPVLYPSRTCFRFYINKKEFQVIDDPMAMLQDETGPIHVSYQDLDNVIDEKRYRFLVSEVKMDRTLGNPEANPPTKPQPLMKIQLRFDQSHHPDMGDRKMFDSFFQNVNSLWRQRDFLLACNINREMFREEEVIIDGVAQFRPDGKPLTRCVYSVKDQFDSIVGAAVYGDVYTEEFETDALDGVSKAVRKVSKIKKYSKV